MRRRGTNVTISCGDCDPGFTVSDSLRESGQGKPEQRSGPGTFTHRARHKADAVIAGEMTSAEEAVLRELWRITASGNNAEVRQHDGHLVVYEVKKSITVG